MSLKDAPLQEESVGDAPVQEESVGDNPMVTVVDPAPIVANLDAPADDDPDDPDDNYDDDDDDDDTENDTRAWGCGQANVRYEVSLHGNGYNSPISSYRW